MHLSYQWEIQSQAKGKFYKEIYEIVLKAQTSSINRLKPGVNYADIQTDAFKIILQGLKTLGLLQGDVNEMFAKNVHSVFMPHHLGHYIGYKTHDVGLQVKEGRDKEERKGYSAVYDNAILQKGMTLTVEPGIYFIDVLIEKSKSEEIQYYFNYQVINDYKKEIGGVRIEDCLIITEDGFENCTDCPRTVEQIEKCMRGEPWR